MRYIKESSTFTQFQTRNHMKGLPFYGQKGDFNFVSGRSQFTPGVSIKLLPLSDMSLKSDPGIGEFRSNVNMIKANYRPGDRVRGILVNSQIDNENGKVVVGKLSKIEVNEADHTVKVYIMDPTTLESKEIYVDTMERLYESNRNVLTFSQFLAS